MDSRMLLAACAVRHDSNSSNTVPSSNLHGHSFLRVQLLASSASALVPLGARMDAARTTCRASRSSLALAGIRMDAAGDPDDEPSAQAPPDEASASAQRRAAEEDQEKWRLPHVDETVRACPSDTTRSSVVTLCLSCCCRPTLMTRTCRTTR